VRVLAVLAWAAWVGAALAPWYTSTRVDLEPDRVTGLGIALIPHVLVLVPFVVATVACGWPRALPWWVPVTVFVAAVPGVLVGVAIPGVIEASATDTEVVAEQGGWILAGAVLLAVTAVAVASRSRSLRPPTAGWTG
jgi:hypothetical protein